MTKSKTTYVLVGISEASLALEDVGDTVMPVPSLVPDDK